MKTVNPREDGGGRDRANDWSGPMIAPAMIENNKCKAFVALVLAVAVDLPRRAAGHDYFSFDAFELIAAHECVCKQCPRPAARIRPHPLKWLTNFSIYCEFYSNEKRKIIHPNDTEHNSSKRAIYRRCTRVISTWVPFLFSPSLYRMASIKWKWLTAKATDKRHKINIKYEPK